MGELDTCVGFAVGVITLAALVFFPLVATRTGTNCEFQFVVKGETRISASMAQRIALLGSSDRC